MEMVAYLGPLVPPKAFEVNFTINPPLLAPVTIFWSLVKKLSKSVALKTKLVFCGHILAPAGIVKLLSAAPVLNESIIAPVPVPPSPSTLMFSISVNVVVEPD